MEGTDRVRITGAEDSREEIPLPPPLWRKFREISLNEQWSQFLSGTAVMADGGTM